MPKLTGISHVDLAVSDLDRSISFYTRAIGVAQLFRGRNEAEHFEVAYMAEPTTGTILGLVKHDTGSAGAFDPRKSGLDHLSFAVADPAELHEWARHLAEVGIETGGVTQQPPFGAGLNFTDPDGIALEFYYLDPQVVAAK
ncbi:MAG: VOC family protein [Dehalococcoidia bacterium]